MERAGGYSVTSGWASHMGQVLILAVLETFSALMNTSQKPENNLIIYKEMPLLDKCYIQYLSHSR